MLFTHKQFIIKRLGISRRQKQEIGCYTSLQNRLRRAIRPCKRERLKKLSVKADIVNCLGRAYKIIIKELRGRCIRQIFPHLLLSIVTEFFPLHKGKQAGNQVSKYLFHFSIVRVLCSFTIHFRVILIGVNLHKSDNQI